ncbi:MAG: hypothetical protein QOJ46_237 [bacterium]
MTPTGVRDGDPDALAGLCDVRGPAVFAYCEVVAGRGERAAAAAAAAFGSFRAGVVATGDLGTLNPEALLISATRHSAARYASADAPEACVRVPGLLAARADRSITLADQDWLTEHLESCWTCRAPVARFEVADKAYRAPPDTPLAAEVKAAMVAAMTAAAPIRRETAETPALAGDGVQTGYAAPAAPATNGNSPHAEPEYAPPAEEPYTAYDLPALDPGAPSSLDEPTSAHELPADGLAPSDPSELSADARRARRRRTRARTGMLGALGAGERKPAGAEPGPAPQARPDRRDRTTRRTRPARGFTAPAATAALAAETSGAEAWDGPAGASPTRPRRQLSGAATNRGRGLLRPAVVLPIALVVIAIIVALVVAGVFGGGEPASAPQSFSPARSDTPTSTQAAPVVVVPGAGTASAAAVEKAKARARAAKAKKKKAAAPKTSPAVSNAGATAPPPVAVNPVVPPPPPATPAKSNGSSGAKPKIDAGNGATGAEQLPPAKDTSTVPELAPPVEPAPPPG